MFATLAAFEVRYDLPVVFAPTAEADAARIERWAYWFSRETVEATNNLLRGCRQGGPWNPDN